eukprot:592982-Pyramimonas_sp.AAC.1
MFDTLRLTRVMSDPTLPTRPLVRRAQSSQCNMDPATIEYRECAHAEGAIAGDRTLRSSLEKSLVVAPHIQTLHDTEFDCYDETPMSISVKQFDSQTDPIDFVDI